MADAKWRKIADALQVDLSEVHRAVEEIKSCNPRPGLQFHSSPPRYVSPDVYVEKMEDEYVILLNERGYAESDREPVLSAIVAAKR